MLEAVKVLRTKERTLEVRGLVPDELIDFLQSHYGDYLQILEADDELINAKESTWYKETEQTMTPGMYLRIYRENARMTQAQLAEKLGVTRFRVSEYEREVRGISKQYAKKLAKILGVPADRFI